MSRVYRVPAPSTTRRPPATRPSLRPAAPTSTASRSMTRGVRAPGRGGSMHVPPPRPDRYDADPHHEVDRTSVPERTTHMGDGYHMITPSTAKREQLRRQADNEQRQYEAHVERSRMHGIREVHRLGGDALSEEEVRRRQAEQYRRDKFARLEKSHHHQSQKKQEEEREIEARKQAARLQALENEKHDRTSQLRTMRPTADQNTHEATGWTDTAREEDRRDTMDRFLNRFTQQYDAMAISSEKNERTPDHDRTKAEKLAVLRDMLPYVDDETLEYHFDVYHGNIDAIVQALLP